MVRTRNNRSCSGGGAGGGGGGGAHKDNAATLRPAAKKGRKRQLTESSGSSQASMLTASSALSPLPGPSSALVALVAPQESDWHLAGPGQSNNNNMEEVEDQHTDHDIVPVAGDLVIFSHRDSAASVSLSPSVSSGEETNPVKEDASCSLVLPEDLKQNLECPVCARISLPPIMQCRNGHVTCNPCRLKVQSCPMCREVDIDIRSDSGSDSGSGGNSGLHF